MEEFRTCDSVLDDMENRVRNKLPVGAHRWVEGAQYLNILRAPEQDRMFELQQMVAQAKVECIKDNHSAAAAKMIVESSDVYREMLKQKAKLERIEEAIRIAKIQARLSDEERKGY